MNIFVAKLSSSTSGDDLRELFGRFGEVVRSSVVLDRDTGESRGFGFVEMRDDDTGRAAIEELDGFTFNGRAMVVKEAEDRRGGGGSSGGPPRERRAETGDRPARPDRGEPRSTPPPSSEGDEGPRRERGWSNDKPKRAAEPERKPKKSSLKAPDKSSRKQPKKGRWVDDFEDDF